MKKAIFVFTVFLAALGFLEVSFARSVSVQGHYRGSGKYVAPYTRTAPNKTKADNWSTKGNVNPYTGKVGSKKP